MSNTHEDIPGSQIKMPTRMPMESWDILEIDKGVATTQKPN